MSEIIIHRLIRSKRRSVSIEIDRNAELIVRVPERISKAYIEDILCRKKEWIVDTQTRILTQIKSAPSKTFTDGEEFFYLGVPYVLRLVNESESPFLFNSIQAEFCLQSRYQPFAREYFVEWYKEQALIHISERLETFASQFQINYEVIHITDAETRWGSCSATGSLNFSWRLVMAPRDVIDYVVIHELAHRQELNHSDRFWDLVERWMPGYQTQEAWLKNQGHLLTL